MVVLKAEHQIEITKLNTEHHNKLNALNDQIEDIRSTHARELNEQEMFYEGALDNQKATYDKLLADKETELANLNIEHQKEITEYKETISNITQTNSDLKNEVIELKASKENQRIEFNSIIEKLKQGHIEAINALKASNKTLTDEIAKQVIEVKTLNDEKKELIETNKELKIQLESVKGEVESLKSDKIKLEEDNQDLNNALQVYEDDNKKRLEQVKEDKNPDPKKPKNK